MYKLFAVMCFLVNGAVECTEYNDSYKKIYEDLAKCEKDAEARFYGLTGIFDEYGQPYERIVIGCREHFD